MVVALPSTVEKVIPIPLWSLFFFLSVHLEDL